MPGNRCGRSHNRADEVRAAVLALAAFEIPIRSTGGPFSRKQYIRIHGDAHAATRIAPFESGVLEYFVEPFGLRLLLDDHRARHDKGSLKVLGNVLAGNY